MKTGNKTDFLLVRIKPSVKAAYKASLIKEGKSISSDIMSYILKKISTNQNN